MCARVHSKGISIKIYDLLPPEKNKLKKRIIIVSSKREKQNFLPTIGVKVYTLMKFF